MWFRPPGGFLGVSGCPRCLEESWFSDSSVGVMVVYWGFFGNCKARRIIFIIYGFLFYY